MNMETWFVMVVGGFMACGLYDLLKKALTL